MSIQIEVTNQQDAVVIADQLYELVRTCLMKAAAMEEVKEGEVSVSFVDDGEIQRLNHQFRSVDRPTDVLAFPMDDDDRFPEGFPPLLGDIVISMPRVVEQANEYGHSVERELGFLVVHGFLHLLGYDHETDETERVMVDKQRHVLNAVGLRR